MGRILYYTVGNTNINDLGEGIISVPFLPERGQIGNIYKNRQDSEYYIWNEKKNSYDLLSEISGDSDLILGQEFKIYYSPIRDESEQSELDRYYILDPINNKFIKLQTEPNVVTDVNDVERITEGQQTVNNYVLQPDTFYNIDNWDKSNGLSTTLQFNFNPTQGMIAGRFTAWADDMNLIWPIGTEVVDSDSLEITTGHTYEFNIWLDKCIIKDVTGGE